MSSEEDSNRGSKGSIIPEMPITNTPQQSQLPETMAKEEMMNEASIPIFKSIVDKVDMAMWYKKIKENSDERHVTTLVARSISSLSTEAVTNEDPLESYQDQFKGWSRKFFDKVEGEDKRALKAFLRQDGIYTGRRNGTIRRQLHLLLNVEELSEWYLDEFKKAKFDLRSNAYSKQKVLQQPQDQHSNYALNTQNDHRQNIFQQHTPRPLPQ
jgi:hypothetical protein